MLRSAVQLFASLLIPLLCFMVIPLGGLAHDLLPDDSVRRVRLRPTARCTVPRFDDAGLEAALAAGLRGPQRRAAQDQLRLWYHKERARRVPGLTDPAPGVEPWAAVGKAMDSAWPVSPRWPLTSGFGERTHPTLGRRHFHNGVDIGLPSGAPVRASLPGRVSCACEDRVSGRYVVLDHGDALVSVYCHASQLLVEDGQEVEQGELLALSGSTGRSTGPHLHYGVRLGGTWVDPVLLYNLEAAARLGPVEEVAP
jgi:murein DD-endopeptidase MepM/ murein hydrolase activator NlpD